MFMLNNATVTVAQLATWNPNLLGVCDGLVEQFVCARQVYPKATLQTKY